MKKNTFLLLFCLLALSLSGQNTKNLKIMDNSYKVIRQAMRMVDQGKYDEAIAQYNTVPYGDPNYEYAQYEKALALEMSEKYFEAIQIFKELLENPSCTQPKANIYTELGNCYDDMEDFDNAVKMYEQGLKENPYYFHLHFNKGVSLMRQEKYAEALECLKTSMFLSPAHQGSHYQYGMCCLKLGYTVPGIMALNYCTLINPSHRYTLLALNTLNEIYESGVGSYNADNHCELHDDFKELNKFYEDVVTKLNIAIISQKKEKLLTKIDHPITRGNQIVFQNVQVRPNSHAVEDQLYIPFFKAVLDAHQYNTLAYYQFSGTDIDNNKVSKKAEKMQKSIAAMQQAIIDQLDAVIVKGLNQENPDNIFYSYNKYQLVSWGKVAKNDKGEDSEQGLWHALNDHGQIDEINEFDHGAVNGMSIGFADNRKMIELQISHGKKNGFIRTYAYTPFSEKGVTTLEASAKDDVISGPYKEYNKSGILVFESTVGPEGLNGETRRYDDQGHLASVENHKDGVTYGHQESFFPNGQIQVKYDTDDNGTVNPFVRYYPNGKVQTQGFIADNDLTGQFSERYPDGTPLATYSYGKDEEYDGENISYYPNGNIKSRMHYKDGKIDGDRIEYDFDGKPVVTYHVKNGQVVDAETYMPDGSVRATVTPKNKHITVDLYSSHGTLLGTNSRTLDLKFDGTLYQYYPNGDVFCESNYKENLREGVTKYYYNSGRVHSYVEYKKGAQNGIYIDYYDDEAHTVEKECQFRNDTLTGALYSYFHDGSLHSKMLYAPDGNLVYCSYYLPNGKMIRELRYYNGLPVLINSFNTDGKLIHCDTILFGNGHSNYYHPNGRVNIVREIKNGELDGSYIEYSFDGTRIDSCYYISGSSNGILKNLYPTGEVSDSCSTILNNIEGYACSFSPLGNITSISYAGFSSNKQGPCITFYPDGKKLDESTILDGDVHGPVYIYAPDNGTLLLEVFHDHGAPINFRYRQSNGKMSEPQAITKDAISVTAYYPNGKIGLVANFENAVLHGNFVIYYPNGNAAYTCQFKNGSSNDQTTYYFPNGKINMKYGVSSGVSHGPLEIYYENGQKAYEGNYYYGLAHGDFKKYDKNGKLLHKVTMYYDHCNGEERY